MADRFGLSVLSSLALLGACDQAPPTAARPQPSTAAGASDANGVAGEGGIRLPLLRPSGDMLMASLEGILRAEGRCLYIVEPGGARNRILPVFHIAGIRWDPATRTLRAGNDAVAEGQRIILAGGEPANPEALDWIQPPDPSCATSKMFMAGRIKGVPERGHSERASDSPF